MALLAGLWRRRGWQMRIQRHFRVSRWGIRAWLPPANFITLHYAYFILTCMITSGIFYASSTNFFVSYVDSLYLVVSAMTESGLNSVNLSQITTWQQVLLWLLMILGSTIWVSVVTVLARKSAFERRFDAIVRAERERALKRRETWKALPMMDRILSIRKTQTVPPPRHVIHDTEPADRRKSVQAEPPRPIVYPPESTDQSTLVDHDDTWQITPTNPPENAGANRADGHIAFATATRPHALSSSSVPSTQQSVMRARPRQETDGVSDDDAHHWRHILTGRTVGRNAQFHGLSSHERERLGGYEYRALKMLAIVVPLYGFLWQFLGALALGAWIARYTPQIATDNGVGAWWAGVFYAVSAFNNNGMSLIDLNMIPFQTAYFVLIAMALLILAGNTAYPLFLRLTFWTTWKVLKLLTNETAFCDTKSTLEFVLNYPRRVYTNLFPSRPTWWLLFMIILLNGIDWLLFEVLNIGNPVTEAIPLGPRVLDGLFQAIAVRSGGFYVIPISAAYPGLQVMYVIMMYISVYPVVITMRHSNVYEERSLGIYANDPRPESDPEDSGPYSSLGTALKRTLSFQGIGVNPPDKKEDRISFISQQIRSQLAHDLWWLALAVFAITTIETRQFLEDPLTFNVFNVLFEVVSAYGSVGISVGLPTQNYSFSGAWSTGSKLVLCLVMLRGRHRGLPVALDRAVRLPGQRLSEEEEEDHKIRSARTLKT
ncbi:high-affinity potassium transport protein [Echria macrotheca]|uniref:Potassium transport protein n=1 Tax=Echria macrotheca TaxID=438768 RepID=A0AAJ0F870_9PEZI|nr:high-affinity potassium transport protein [Echria macrotheca]